MEYSSAILDKLTLIQRRLYRGQLIQNCMCYGVCGLTMVGILLLMNRFVRLPVDLLIVLVVLFTGILIVVASRKLDLLKVARITDDCMALKDRLSTAVEITRKKAYFDFDKTQLRDAANKAEKIVPSSDFPLEVPALWKLAPIPIFLICLSFFLPDRSELLGLPTAVEQQVIDQTVNHLESFIDSADEGLLVAEIRETIEKLQAKRITNQMAQDSLSQLRDQVRRHEAQITDRFKETQKAIYGVTNTLTVDLASDFDKLTDQFDGLGAEQMLELKRKLQQIAVARGQNNLINDVKTEFSNLRSEVVSAKELERMAETLLDLDRQRLAEVENTLTQIRESRKRIALAGIEINQSGSIADNSGNAGRESGANDVKGVDIRSSNYHWTPSEEESAIVQDTPVQARLDGGGISLHNNNSIDLKLNTISSDRQGFSHVFVRQSYDGSIEPEYIPFQKAHLNAKQNYAEAIRRDRIPIRYRQQISDYLDAIAQIGEP